MTLCGTFEQKNGGNQFFHLGSLIFMGPKSKEKQIATKVFTVLKLNNGPMRKITILTQPFGFTLFKRKIVERLRRVKHLMLRKKSSCKKINGPSSVLMSLLKGLHGSSIPFNYNPVLTHQIHDNVVVLSNIEALKQAIRLKKKGRIANLFAGPNLVALPHEENGILTSPEIDVCIVPCKWVKKSYETDAPSLKEKIRIWPAGVDQSFWSPSKKKVRSKNILIYKKNDPFALEARIVILAKKYGWTTKTIHYGSYKQIEYKQLLNSSDLAVFLSISESQGIALLEAWAMNIPTLVWNPGKRTVLNQKNVPVSSAPYLTEKTGATWKTLDELENLLAHHKIIRQQFQPRKWVLANMINTITTQKLYSIITNSQPHKISF